MQTYLLTEHDVTFSVNPSLGATTDGGNSCFSSVVVALHGRTAPARKTLYTPWSTALGVQWYVAGGLWLIGRAGKQVLEILN